MAYGRVNITSPQTKYIEYLSGRLTSFSPSKSTFDSYSRGNYICFVNNGYSDSSDIVIFTIDTGKSYNNYFTTEKFKSATLDDENFVYAITSNNIVKFSIDSNGKLVEKNRKKIEYDGVLKNVRLTKKFIIITGVDTNKGETMVFHLDNNLTVKNKHLLSLMDGNVKVNEFSNDVSVVWKEKSYYIFRDDFQFQRITFKFDIIDCYPIDWESLFILYKDGADYKISVVKSGNVQKEYSIPKNESGYPVIFNFDSLGNIYLNMYGWYVGYIDKYKIENNALVQIKNFYMNDSTSSTDSATYIQCSIGSNDVITRGCKMGSGSQYTFFADLVRLPIYK